ncbi:NAD(P)-dependent oxidoreductase [Hymenobacter pini]|uniref:NAD(P)-dependent oxidoreductase n=1 Tax=Hymenobacter pini TaxID=2880879 RepID=UPI00293D76EF|nr:NAD(P)-dependent oxidoreductase [Hymenobacter pini]
MYSALSNKARAELLQQLPPEVTTTFRTDLAVADQQTALQAAELLLGNPPAAWLQESLPPYLRFWQIDSAGIDQYRQVQPHFPVANMGDFFAWACAETMVAGLLALLRYIPELAVWQTQRHWEGAALRSRMGLLRHRRIIILGRGTIGLAVARQLQGFDCPVQFLARTDANAQLHTRDQLLAALPHTDILINCLPGAAGQVVTREVLAALPAHAIYASVGRGNTTDEPALIEALTTQRLAGAVLDVTAQEPLPADSPLWHLPRVLLTQHSGGGQPHEDEGKVALFLRNLRHVRQQEPLENPVQLHRGY